MSPASSGTASSGILSPHYWPRAMAEKESPGALPRAELHPLPHSPGGTRNLVLQRDKGFLSTGQSGAEVLGKGAEPGQQRVWQMDRWEKSASVGERKGNPGRRRGRQFLDLTQWYARQQGLRLTRTQFPLTPVSDRLFLLCCPSQYFSF